MAWFKVDDGFAEHPKVIHVRALAGDAPLGMWLRAGTWSNRQLTDGFVPVSWIALNGDESHAQILVTSGLWVEDASRDGWQFKDFMEYQPSKADVEARRSKDLTRKRPVVKDGAREERNKKRLGLVETHPGPEAV